MTHRIKALGVIGARSGSVSIKNKNIKLFNKEPLIVRIIRCALESKVLDRVIVSTDSEAYAQIALRYGAEVPFLRPKAISSEHSEDIEYIVHTLDWLKQHENYIPDIVLRLLPTTPFQKACDIENVVEVLQQKERYDSALVITKSRISPEKLLRLKKGESDLMELVDYMTGKPEYIEPRPRQTLVQGYVRANIIASRVDSVRKLKSLVGKRIGYVEIPQERGIDIDSELDFFIAEQLLNKIE